MVQPTMKYDKKTANNIEGVLKTLAGSGAIEIFGKEVLVRLAVAMRSRIRETIIEGRSDWPPLSDYTVSVTGNKQPLINTGEMLDSIKVYRVKKNLVEVGIEAGAIHSDSGVEIATIAAKHEYGAVAMMGETQVIIPARPFLRPSIYENMGTWEDMVADLIRQSFMDLGV